MCEKCFMSGKSTFVSEREYREFIQLLKSKTSVQFIGSNPGGLGKSRFELFGIGFGGNIDHGFDIYKCSSCNQSWKLSEPDNAWRGYFSRADQEDELLTRK